MLNAGCKNRKSSKLTTSAFGTIVACSLSLFPFYFVECTHIHIRIHVHVRTVWSTRAVCFLWPRAKIVDIFHLHQYQYGWQGKGRGEREGYGERGRESKVGQASNGFSFCRV